MKKSAALRYAIKTVKSLVRSKKRLKSAEAKDSLLCLTKDEILTNPYLILGYNLLIDRNEQFGLAELCSHKAKDRYGREDFRDYSYCCYLYARDVIGGRWPDGEKSIVTPYQMFYDEGWSDWPGYDIAINYALEVIKGRWPELESHIFKRPSIDWLLSYAKQVVKSPWPELENYLLKHDIKSVHHILEYVIETRKSRWPEGERRVLKSIKTNKTYGNVFQEAPYYAKKVIKGRWPEYEKLLLTTTKGKTWFANDSIHYIEVVMKCRWPELEELLLTKWPQHASCYACDIIKDRWPEAEPFILSRTDRWAASGMFGYARDAIKGRWPEAEAIIAQNKIVSKLYCELFRGTERRQVSQRLRELRKPVAAGQQQAALLAETVD